MSWVWVLVVGKGALVIDKPPYRVPLMSEIAATPWNGFSAISFFSGAGGSSLGYRIAGFRMLYANEFVEAARETYQANAAPYTVLDGRDIRTVTPADVLQTIGLEPGELDLLDGSPPCSSFSTAGKREKGWGESKSYSDVEQRTDDLFLEFVRMVDGIRPKTFVAENVSGLVKGTAKGWFLRILAALKAAGGGYRVEARLLDAQWLGVPQARQRLIFVGVRADLGLDPVFPAPLHYRYSIRDALPGLPIAAVGSNGKFGTEGWQTADEPAKTIGTSPTSGNGRVGPGDLMIYREQVGQKIAHAESVPENVGASLEGYAVGSEWEKLIPGAASEKFFSLVKPDADRPCPTVTAQGVGATSGAPGGVASVTHPFEKRKFTIAELKRISGFPDDVILTGSYPRQWERLGRAVPPAMMAYVAAAVRDGVLRKL